MPQVRGAINPGRPSEGGEGVHAGRISDSVFWSLIWSAEHGPDLAAFRGVRDGAGRGGRGFQRYRSRAVHRQPQQGGSTAGLRQGRDRVQERRVPLPGAEGRASAHGAESQDQSRRNGGARRRIRMR